MSISKKQIQLLVCIISSLITYYIANGITAFLITPQFDALNHTLFYAGDYEVSLGRILLPAYGKFVSFRGVLSPFVISFRTVLYNGIISYLIYEYFPLDAPTILLYTGVLNANVMMTSLCGVFKYVEDAYIFGNMLAVFGVFLLFTETDTKFACIKFCFATMSLVVAVSIYQASVSYALSTLILFIFIDSINNHVGTKKYFRALLSFAISGIIYSALYKIVVYLKGVTVPNRDNSLSSLSNISIIDLIHKILNGYQEFYQAYYYNGFYLSKYNVVFNWLLFLIFISSLLYLFKELEIRRKILSLLCIMVFPLLSLSTYILMEGNTIRWRYRIISPMFLWYIWQIICVIKVKQKLNVKTQIKKWIDVLCFGLIMMIFITNARFSNAAYTVEKLLYDRALSQTTRILYDLSNIPEYKSGYTTVIVIGQLAKNNDLSNIAGDMKYLSAYFNSAVAYPQTLESYSNILGERIKVEYDQNIVDDYIKMQQVEEMPNYPMEGYIRVENGKVIVKLSDPNEQK
mgnify:CR=1 FL=1